MQSGFTVLAELPEGSITMKEKNTLEKTVALSHEKKLVYDDFDRRAIKGTPEFTIEDRFMYLRERNDDETSDRFDLSIDGYNINQHYDYLETKHNEMLASDPEFKEQYEVAGQISEV